MHELIKESSLSDFQKDVLEESYNRPVLVDCWAQWCGPCKQLMPVLHQVVESLAGAVVMRLVDADAEQELAMQLQVRSLPTVLLFINGEIMDQFTGVKSESEVRAFLATYLVSDQTKSEEIEVSAHVKSATDFIAEGRYDEAITLLKNDASLPAKELLFLAYILEKKIDQAQQLYQSFEDEIKQSKKIENQKHQLDLLIIASKSSYQPLQDVIDNIIDNNDVINGLSDLLSLLEQVEEKSEIKKAIVIGFNLIDDKALVSQLRRKMSSIIFR